MAYVSPTQEMIVRPGQHVSADGRIYHPYLAQWANYWDVSASFASAVANARVGSSASTITDMSTIEQRSNLVNFLQILADVFAKEPPVITRQQQPRQQYDSTAGGEQSSLRFTRSVSQVQQPLPPPKPPKSTTFQEPGLSPHNGHRGSIATGPPEPPAVPPKPGIADGPDHYNTGGTQRRHYASSQQQDNVQVRGPPLPPLPPNVSTLHARPMSYMNGARPNQNWILPQQQRPPSASASPARFTSHHPNNNLSPSMRPQPHYPARQTQMQQPTGVRQRQSQPTKQPQDLMSAPLEIILPSQHESQIAAPPIPPNPEKDALLRAISQALIGQLTRTTAQNSAAISPLEAQNAAMQQAYRNLSNEVAQLQDLDKMLTLNEKILHETMREADKQLDSVGRKEKPKVDEVLVAPTVVGEQLYGLVADERAIADTMFALTKALDKGRIAADVYVKVCD